MKRMIAVLMAAMMLTGVLTACSGTVGMGDGQAYGNVSTTPNGRVNGGGYESGSNGMTGNGSGMFGSNNGGMSGGSNGGMTGNNGVMSGNGNGSGSGMFGGNANSGTGMTGGR